ncbi:hypothetical protein BDR06DRAFT_968180 [Suillus hirtellus]|nr:hypothetical protein BDR06DRAFT_968180 [Suillus hirtellus]
MAKQSPRKSRNLVTKRKKYGFKYLVGNSRGCIEAMDVDNKEDYMEMTKKLISKEPQKVKVFVNMKNIEKLPVSITQNEVHGDENWLIIKKWGNSHDNSVTYIHQSRMEIPWTLAMIKDWAHAMEVYTFMHYEDSRGFCVAAMCENIFDVEEFVSVVQAFMQPYNLEKGSSASHSHDVTEGWQKLGLMALLKSCRVLVLMCGTLSSTTESHGCGTTVPNTTSTFSMIQELDPPSMQTPSQNTAEGQDESILAKVHM